MGRQLRVASQTGLYHIVSRGNNRQAVFLEDSDFQFYRAVLGKYGNEHPVKIHHYCLMGNHVHLLARVAEIRALSRFMHDVQRSFFLYRQRKGMVSGHRWQGRFGSFPIEDEPYVLECGRYIERNPVRAGIVGRPEDYLWSSYRHYAYGIRDPLITDAPLYAGLGQDDEERRERYRNYVGVSRPYEDLKPVPGTRYPVPK